MTAPVQPIQPIQKSDIRAKFDELTGGVGEEVAAAKNIALVASVAVGVVVVLGVYLLGRRRGRRRTTVLEVRRL